VRRLPAAIALGQITPWNAGSVSINDGIDKQAVVRRRAANMALPPRQKVLDLCPLVVAQGVALHLSASPLPTVHESEKK